MTGDISISLAGQNYRLSTLRRLSSVDQLPQFDILPGYAQEALQFCHQWVQGATSFVQHTSGSTGKPKPIEIKREQMQASARMTIATLGLQTGDRALVCLGANYIAGKMMLVRAMEAGMDVLVVPPSSLPLSDVADPVDFVALVPLQLKSMLDVGEQALLEQMNRMRAILVGGGAVSSGLEKSIRENLTCPVYSTYGMTETVSHIALRRMNATQATDLFRTLGDVEIKTDQRGCLMIRGTVTLQQWLATNDVVEVVDHNHFRWLGRADNIINSGGIKVQIEQLEKKLEEGVKLLGVDRQYFVAGLPDEKLGERISLIVQGSKAKPTSLKGLRRWLAENISTYEQPRQVIFVPAFKFTGSGKVIRKESKDLALGHKSFSLR